MANDCGYNIMAVSKSKEALERLIRIMNYEDNEYFIYRCFICDADKIAKSGDYFYVNISGDVAWSVSVWFETNEDKKRIVRNGFEKNEDGTSNYDKPIFGTAHYITLDLVCKRLGIALECYTEEPGNCFQEHFLVNHLGNVVVNECTEWSGINEEDLPKPDDKESLEQFLEEHALESLDNIKWGFDDYCSFLDYSDIYDENAEED